MTTAPRPGLSVDGGGRGRSVEVVRLPSEWRLEGAARLIGDPQGARGQGARRMVLAAAQQGIDLSLMWGAVERDSMGRISGVRQAALLVPGSGKTAMVVVSHPVACGAEAEERECRERAACVDAACVHAGSREWGRSPVTLAQALPDPQEEWAVRSLTVAGFRTVGDLAYLRREGSGLGGLWSGPAPEWPEGVVVRNVIGARAGEVDRERMLAALERSYVDTLDCPELCGLRETKDVLDSHLSAGKADMRRWWLVLLKGEPHGCLLLNHAPELEALELVYLGLSPEVRGKGIGGRLLRMGLSRCADLGVDQVTCAVDLRNTPARRLYMKLGFEEAGRRVAMVRPVRAAP